MIYLDNIVVYYRETMHYALHSINLEFSKGEFVCILGKSGAGKSTLIRCMNGLQKISSGEIYWKGEPLSLKNEKGIRNMRKEIAMIFQNHNLIPRLTVMQNVLTGLFGYRNTFKNIIGLFSKEEIELAKQKINEVGLSDHIYRKIEYLSGGQKQRVGIARSLLQRPKVFLCDEPVSSLDPHTAENIFIILKRLNQRHRLLTIVNVHDVSLAKRYADRIIALKDGKLIFDGKPEDFTENTYKNVYGSIVRTNCIK